LLYYYNKIIKYHFTNLLLWINCFIPYDVVDRFKSVPVFIADSVSVVALF